MSKVLQRSTTLSIAAAIVLIDQLSKAALSAVLVDGNTMTAIPGILSLQLFTTAVLRSACLAAPPNSLATSACW
jgi:lipoprotein signal peptidase